MHYVYHARPLTITFDGDNQPILTAEITTDSSPGTPPVERSRIMSLRIPPEMVVIENPPGFLQVILSCIATIIHNTPEQEYLRSEAAKTLTFEGKKEWSA